MKKSVSEGNHEHETAKREQKAVAPILAEATCNARLPFFLHKVEP